MYKLLFDVFFFLNKQLDFRYVLSITFIPGDRHVLAGLKDGTLLIIDISAGDVLEEIPAHTTELWSICLQPNMVCKLEHSFTFSLNINCM